MTLQDVAEKANPAVVTISTETTVKGRSGPATGSPFDEFFRRMYPQEGFKQQGLGSGVIIKSSGIILTNNHVIENADDIMVRLIDGREHKAEIKGTDSAQTLQSFKLMLMKTYRPSTSEIPMKTAASGCWQSAPRLVSSLRIRLPPAS